MGLQAKIIGAFRQLGLNLSLEGKFFSKNNQSTQIRILPQKSRKIFLKFLGQDLKGVMSRMKKCKFWMNII